MKEIIFEGNEIQAIQIQKSNSRKFIVEITGSSTGDPVPTKFVTHYGKFPNYNVIKILSITQNHIVSLLARCLHISYVPRQCSNLVNVGIEIADFINTLPCEDLYLLGHSKGGLELLVALPRLQIRPKLAWIISVPGKGTISANKEKAEEQGNLLERLFYELTFSNSPLDKAISKPSVLEDSGINMQAICKEFGLIMINFISFVDDSCQITKLSDLVCWYLHQHKDLRLTKQDSKENDGIVPFSSQKLSYVNTKFIQAFHSSSLDVVREELKKILIPPNGV